tara:strand:+ start:458 stop:1081 length:624 start_codon:yes stop_codon:yes gene_type:complete
MVFKDTFNIISLMTPYLIPLYLLMGSFFNQDLKGLFYLGLLTINVYLTFFVSKFLRIQSGINSESNVCNFGPFNGFLTTMGSYNNNSLSINSSIIGFTLSYLAVPMYNNNNINYSIIAMFMVLFSINGWVQLSNQCAKAVSIILGGVIGMLMGYTIVTFLDTIDKNMRALLYFNETLDKSKTCKLTKQKYSCRRVSLNGPLIDKSNM